MVLRLRLTLRFAHRRASLSMAGLCEAPFSVTGLRVSGETSRFGAVLKGWHLQDSTYDMTEGMS